MCVCTRHSFLVIAIAEGSVAIPQRTCPTTNPTFARTVKARSVPDTVIVTLDGRRITRIELVLSEHK